MSRGGEERSDTEESELEQAVVRAPVGLRGAGPPTNNGPGNVERQYCDGQGMPSPGWRAPYLRHTSRQPNAEECLQHLHSHSRHTSTVKLLSELALVQLEESLEAAIVETLEEGEYALLLIDQSLAG